jgi:hypothetical protein
MVFKNRIIPGYDLQAKVRTPLSLWVGLGWDQICHVTTDEVLRRVTHVSPVGESRSEDCPSSSRQNMLNLGLLLLERRKKDMSPLSDSRSLVHPSYFHPDAANVN